MISTDLNFKVRVKIPDMSNLFKPKWWQFKKRYQYWELDRWMKKHPEKSVMLRDSGGKLD